MNRISQLRYNALAGYTRRPELVFVGDECGWYAHDDERLLGIIVLDRADQDYTGVVLRRDAAGRFRAAKVMASLPTYLHAKDWLWKTFTDSTLAEVAMPKTALNFFEPVVARERLHESFKVLAENRGFSPARGIIEAMMNYYEDPDGNFVEQFQTTGFDSRVWELYLFAALVELGFVLDRAGAVPDFSCERFGEEARVEAVTVNPTREAGVVVAPPSPKTAAEVAEYLEGYAAIKFASALYSKLRKEYWKQPAVAGRPFILAVQDFHRPHAMTLTSSALPMYLYGGKQVVTGNGPDGAPVTAFQPIEMHRYGKKQIPSGFFRLEGAEYISAVLFSSSGTISKFNRMGFLAGFGTRLVSMARSGTRVNLSPSAIEPKVFSDEVTASGYSETWAEGLSLFLNPFAKHPIPKGLFGRGVAVHEVEGGTMISRVPANHPYASWTMVNRTDLLPPG